MNETVEQIEEQAERVIARLRTRGWRRGSVGGSQGPNCLLGALIYEGGYYEPLSALATGINQEIADDPRDLSIGEFNDRAEDVDEVIWMIKRGAERAILAIEKRGR